MWPPMSSLALTLFVLAVRYVAASPIASRSAGPLVNLTYGSFQGVTGGNVDSFLGMPYAQPPVGSLRFGIPQPPLPFEGVQQAVSYGAACPQQDIVLPENSPVNLSGIFPSIGSIISEDCLSINVIRPSSASAGDNLPVLFWIYGGAFGDPAIYDGTVLVERSLTLNEPVIFVSHNYRMNAFGFLASQEVQDAGLTNVGLRDQRLAMQWVNQHISEFGGDPTQVIIWGESAGSFSVAAHLVWNDGNQEGLFSGAVMESGSALALLPMSTGQASYDQLVENVGCAGAADTLDCLRNAPYDDLIAAVALSPTAIAYQSLNLAWEPRIDGDLLTQTGPQYLLAGQYAKVPTISGDCDDEGTLFSVGNLNVTTDEEFLEYIQEFYIFNASASQIAAVGEAYPADPSDGSPFYTGDLNVLTLENKRLAAFQGDWMFQAPRRNFLETVSQTQDAWAFLYQRGKATPYLGSFHSSDLSEFFLPGDFIGMDALINFANNLDPNAPADLAPGISLLSDINWEQWGSNRAAPPMLTFVDPAPAVEITTDTFRADAMSLLNTLALQMPQ